MDLKELLGEDLYSQVTAKLGDKKIVVDDGNLIPKSKLDQVNKDKNMLEKERDLYKRQADLYEGGMTKSEVESLESNLEKKYKINSALEIKLSSIEDESVREFIESKIDKEKITLNEDGINLDGLDEQFNSVSEKYSTLIGNTPINTGSIGNHARTNNNQSSGDSQTSFMEVISNNSLRK